MPKPKAQCANIGLPELPTQYQPKSIEQFYGPARATARHLTKSAEMCLKTGAPAAHLIIGPSGSGKTALAMFALEKAFEVSTWNLTEIFGSDISVERVRELAFSMRLTSLYPGFRGILLDEVNKCTMEARDRLLEIVGDRKQPRETVIIATANMTIEQFDELERTADARGRFTSRFQIHHVPCPTCEEVIPLVECWLPPEKARDLCVQAGTGPHGGKPNMPINTRGLLKDVTSVMQFA